MFQLKGDNTGENEMKNLSVWKSLKDLLDVKNNENSNMPAEEGERKWMPLEIAPLRNRTDAAKRGRELWHTLEDNATKSMG